MNQSMTTQQSPQMTLKAELEKIRPALEAILPKHVTAERMLKVVLSATARTPDLLLCTPQSITRAVMQAGEVGLEIGGLLGEAYLVPYNVRVSGAGGDRWEKQAQCIIGYRGYIKLARQSGQLHSISARVVYARDKFHVNLAQEEIHHEPDFAAERHDSDIVALYAIARFKDEGRQVEVMTRPEVDAIRGRSKAGKSGPWQTDYAEMARKTVVRRLCKYLPLSPELANAFEADAQVDELDRSLAANILVTEAHDDQPRAKSLADRVRARSAAPPESTQQIAEGAMPEPAVEPSPATSEGS